MAINEILPFATTNTGTNLLTQAEYASDAQRTTGHQPGIARSKLENKALRQASLLAAGLAEFIADYQSNNVTDGLTPQDVADYLLLAMRSSLSVTPPQFDNDTSLATTAFVQRALGSYAGTISISAGGTIQQGNVGKATVFGSTAAGQAIYLPSLVGLPAGATIVIHGYGTFDYTIGPQGGQDILARGTVLTSLPMKGADSAVLYKESDTRWVLIGGTVQEVYSPRQASSLAFNGYQKLPSGLIIQWLSGVIGWGTNGSLAYPIAFPNGTLKVLGVVNNAAQAHTLSIAGTSASSVTARHDASTNQDCQFIAIGY